MAKQSADKGSWPGFIDGVDEFSHLIMVKLKGDLDFHAVPEVTRFLDNSDNGRKLTKKSVLFDLRKVEKVDTAVIAQLIVVLSKLKQRNFKLGLMNVPDRLNGIVEILKLEDILRIFPTKSDAFNEILAWSEDWK
ncbi:MAG TPA: STAS domain-containing protein [Candidatus Eisenbacteria bacterium]|jgi:anti-anti-sigma factor|nr:STAS domain-containing protein [Candidatus Eisenbacteria bacterium]